MKPEDMKIADDPHVLIIGAGSLGAMYADRLSAAGIKVSLLTRTAEQRDAWRDAGRPYGVFASAKDAPPADLALLTVKSPDTATAIAAAAPHLPAHCPVLTLQNGLGNIESLALTLGRERVLAGVTYKGALLLRPGRVECSESGDTVIGEPYVRNGARAESVRALLERAGLPCKLADDITGLIWDKLLVNAAINPVAALTGQRNGRLAESETARELMAGLVDEAAAVATALGLPRDPEETMSRVLEVATATAGNKASMLQDILARRRTEIMHINGAVARLGREHGLPCPLNRAVTGLILLREESALRDGDA